MSIIEELVLAMAGKLETLVTEHAEAITNPELYRAISKLL